jgi:hypothetical protein
MPWTSRLRLTLRATQYPCAFFHLLFVCGVIDIVSSQRGVEITTLAAITTLRLPWVLSYPRELLAIRAFATINKMDG